MLLLHTQAPRYLEKLVPSTLPLAVKVGVSIAYYRKLSPLYVVAVIAGWMVLTNDIISPSEARSLLFDSDFIQVTRQLHSEDGARDLDIWS